VGLSIVVIDCFLTICRATQSRIVSSASSLLGLLARRLCESPTGTLLIGKTNFSLPGYGGSEETEMLRYDKTFLDKIVKASIRSANESGQTIKDLRSLAKEALTSAEAEDVDAVLVPVKSTSFWSKITDEISGRLATDAANIVQEHLFTHLFDHARYATLDGIDISIARSFTFVLCMCVCECVCVGAWVFCRYAVVEPLLSAGTPAPTAVPTKQNEAPAAKACRLATSLVHLVCRAWNRANQATESVVDPDIVRFSSRVSNWSIGAMFPLSGYGLDPGAGRWQRKGQGG
jgi:hypothetical protein